MMKPGELLSKLLGWWMAAAVVWGGVRSYRPQDHGLRQFDRDRDDICLHHVCRLGRLLRWQGLATRPATGVAKDVARYTGQIESCFA